MGADIGILSGRTESPVAVGDRMKSVLGPDGPSVVIDCAGFEATMQVRVAVSWSCTLPVLLTCWVGILQSMAHTSHMALASSIRRCAGLHAAAVRL